MTDPEAPGESAAPKVDKDQALPAHIHPDDRHEEVSRPEFPEGTTGHGIVQALHSIYDPEIPVNIFELGLIYEVNYDGEQHHAEVVMTLTSPNCPAAQSLPAEVETKTKLVENVDTCSVKIVWEPRWGVNRMSDEARLALGMM